MALLELSWLDSASVSAVHVNTRVANSRSPTLDSLVHEIWSSILLQMIMASTFCHPGIIIICCLIFNEYVEPGVGGVIFILSCGTFKYLFFLIVLSGFYAY